MQKFPFGSDFWQFWFKKLKTFQEGRFKGKLLCKPQRNYFGCHIHPVWRLQPTLLAQNGPKCKKNGPKWSFLNWNSIFVQICEVYKVIYLSLPSWRFLRLLNQNCQKYEPSRNFRIKKKHADFSSKSIPIIKKSIFLKQSLCHGYMNINLNNLCKFHTKIETTLDFMIHKLWKNRIADSNLRKSVCPTLIIHSIEMVLLVSLMSTRQKKNCRKITYNIEKHIYHSSLLKASGFIGFSFFQYIFITISFFISTYNLTLLFWTFHTFVCWTIFAWVVQLSTHPCCIITWFHV